MHNNFPISTVLLNTSPKYYSIPLFSQTIYRRLSVTVRINKTLIYMCLLVCRRARPFAVPPLREPSGGAAPCLRPPLPVSLLWWRRRWATKPVVRCAFAWRLPVRRPWRAAKRVWPADGSGRVRTGADGNAIPTNPLISFLEGRDGRVGRTISIRILRGVSVVGFEGFPRSRNRSWCFRIASGVYWRLWLIAGNPLKSLARPERLELPTS